MRIQPPETEKTVFKGKEIEQFFMAHHCVDCFGEKFTIPKLLEIIIQENKSIDKSMQIFMSMWPLQYQYMVGQVFYSMAEKIGNDLSSKSTE